MSTSTATPPPTLTPSVHSLPRYVSPLNAHPTETSTSQRQTEHLISKLLKYLPDPSPTTALMTAEHNRYLAAHLFKLPTAYTSLDASKPWTVYWITHSLDLLGVAIDAETRARGVSTILACMHPTLGGFAGGSANTQIPHLLPTYASTLSLAINGHAGEGGGWAELAAHRQKTYDFFMRCKQPDGGFVVADGAEVDVRGTYTLLVVAVLLDLLTPELLHNLDTFISACQTYEGGFACASHSHPSFPTSVPEAHGGYTSCALNSHFLLATLPPSAPSLGEGWPREVSVDGAMRWSAMMQCEAVEGGGFKGRSNKLVDGCYGWWVGGGFAVLEELAKREDDKKGKERRDTPPLFNTVALQEYVLYAAQSRMGGGGGLCDKPGTRPDLYHTCNNLSGLSAAQHHMVHSPALVAANRQRFDPAKGLPAVTPTRPEGGWKSEEERQSVRREVWSHALGWVAREEHVVGGAHNRVNATTPVFNLLPHRLRPFINYFYGQSDA